MYCLIFWQKQRGKFDISFRLDTPKRRSSVLTFLAKGCLSTWPNLDWPVIAFALFPVFALVFFSVFVLLRFCKSSYSNAPIVQFSP